MLRVLTLGALLGGKAIPCSFATRAGPSIHFVVSVSLTFQLIIFVFRDSNSFHIIYLSTGGLSKGLILPFRYVIIALSYFFLVGGVALLSVIYLIFVSI